MKAVIIGYGKMGHEIEGILAERGHTVHLVVDAENRADLRSDRLRGADVALEFTAPDAAYDNLRACIECGLPVVSGTTGWTSRLAELEQLCRERGGALFYASNFSLGVNMLFRINRQLAAMLGRVGGYDASIEEVHHIQKKDAPSGTAITLAEGIISGMEQKNGWVNETPAPEGLVGIRSVREGTVPGIHTVTYESVDDILQLKHTIKHRRTLAMGAVVAAEFLCGRQGVYTMDDLLR